MEIIKTTSKAFVFRTLISILFVFCLIQQSHADIRLHGIFQNHMVLQRETEVAIWGWADPSEKITVEASWGEKVEVVAQGDSTWKVMIKTPKAGGPHQIKFTAKNSLLLRDVLTGEVWLCTGQSNMDWALAKFLNNSKDPKHQPLVEYVREEVATAYDPWIRHIEVPRKISLDNLEKNFDADWVSVNPAQSPQITAIGYFFAKELREKLNVPIGLVECAWGGTRVEPWIPKEAFQNDEKRNKYYEAELAKVHAIMEKYTLENYVDETYEDRVKAWETNGKNGRKPSPEKHPTEDNKIPTVLYNGMLASVVPYSIKGAIWYQGESNAVYMPEEYSDRLEAMITGWRKAWNIGDFPFYWTQLAGCSRGNPISENGWAMVNDQLRRTMRVSNTGMAVLHDIGEARDIHPHNKMDAGKRLAFWALAKDYGIKVEAVSGPLYISKEVSKKKIIISFENTGSGLMVGQKVLLNEAKPVDEALYGFEILGRKGEWKKADAIIVDKNKIEVSSSEISRPIHVRYAWQGYPEGANLYNKEGLPTAVFTTE